LAGETLKLIKLNSVPRHFVEKYHLQYDYKYIINTNNDKQQWGCTLTYTLSFASYVIMVLPELVMPTPDFCQFMVSNTILRVHIP
jgi:hypothetical protein